MSPSRSWDAKNLENASAMETSNVRQKRLNCEQHYTSGRPPMPEAADRAASIANDLLIIPSTTEDRYRNTRNRPRDRRTKFTPTRQVAPRHATAIPYRAAAAMHQGSEFIENTAISTESKISATIASLYGRTMKKYVPENRYNNRQKNSNSQRRVAVLSRNNSEKAARSTDEQYFRTRPYSIKQEAEIKRQKNLDTTISCNG